MSNPDFPRNVVEVVAKRAANICSNPDCRAVTSGPSDDSSKALVIGEAAHIFGAKPTSSRFKQAMTNAERADTTNAIWLCRNCHKLVDGDPLRHPAEALFEWRSQHEREVTGRLGKPSELILQKIIDEQLSEFRSASRLAQRIVADKPDYWEYKLTVELLRGELNPVLKR